MDRRVWTECVGKSKSQTFCVREHLLSVGRRPSTWGQRRSSTLLNFGCVFVTSKTSPHTKSPPANHSAQRHPIPITPKQLAKFLLLTKFPPRLTQHKKSKESLFVFNDPCSSFIAPSSTNEHPLSTTSTGSRRFRHPFPKRLNFNSSRLSRHPNHPRHFLHASCQWKDENSDHSDTPGQETSTHHSSPHRHMEFDCEKMGNPTKDTACLNW